MDSLCQELHRTYNTNLLDRESNLTQAVFLNASEKNKDKSLGNTTLMRLIYNHYRVQKPMPRYIGGPSHLSNWYSKKYGKNIYLFGEFHEYKYDCSTFKSYDRRTGPQETMRIDDFLIQLMKTTDVFLDIFVESQPFQKEGEYPKLVQKARTSGLSSKYILTKTNVKLDKCILFKNRHNKECQLSRIHYIDAREVHDESNIFIDFINSPYTVKTMREANEFLGRPKSKKIMEVFSGHADKIVHFMQKQLLKNFLVKKELNRSYLKDEIMAFAYEKIRITVENFRAKIYRANIDLKKDKLLYIYRLSAVILELMVPLTDTYTLARMFKRFNVKKRAHKYDTDKVVNQPEEPHNIIVYAGLNHIKLYIQFLTYLKFNLVARSGYRNEHFGQDVNPSILANDDLSCVSLVGFPQPFFTAIN